MERQEQIERIEKFLNEIMIQELGKVVQADLAYTQFVLMGQAVEVLGSLLDNKPMKAKGQSAKRFAQSVNRLFGGRYRVLNDNNMLYDKLRNQMTHTFIPGGDLWLQNREDPSSGRRHLEYCEGKLVLIAEVFYKDICAACRRLFQLLKDGKLKAKNIAFEGYDE